MTKTKLIPHCPHFCTYLIVLLILSACTQIQQAGDQIGTWGQPKQSNTNVIIDPPTREDTSIVRPNQKPRPHIVKDNYPKVNVAILLPLSGPRATIGQSMLQGAQLALFEMRYSQFNLIPRDTKGTGTGAAQAAQAAINDGATIILGPLFSDSVRAVKPIAKNHNINVIAFSTDWALADNSTFLMGFMPFTQVDRVAQYALSKGIRNFGLIAPQDKYGNAVTGQFNEAVLRNGGKMTKSIRYTPQANQNDTAIISQIEAWKPADNTPSDIQAVFMPVSGSAADMVGSALSYNNLTPNKVRRLGTGLWDDTRLANQPNVQGGWFAAPSPQTRRHFEHKYSETYGSRPVRLATLAYDATALAGVLAKNGYNRANAPDFTHRGITNPNGFAGTDGVFRFKQNGIVERQLSILEIRKGSITEIDPAPRRF